MSSKPAPTMKMPRTGSTAWASNPIQAQESISVTTYADGTLRVVHNRLDLMNRRIIPTSLYSGPAPESTCSHRMAHGLYDAAQDWFDLVHAQGSLF